MDLKENLLNIINKTKERFSPYKLLYPQLSVLPINRPIYILALGKAAYQMAKAVVSYTKEEPFIRIAGGLIITKYGNAEEPLKGMNIIEASHPYPDENSIKAADAAIEFLSKLKAEDILLVLLSGGGSALMEKPIEGSSLEAINQRTEILLKSGANIEQINTERKKMSAVKGGKLLKYIKSRMIFIYAMSDVPGDKPKYICSNPFLPDAEKAEDEMGSEAFHRFDNLTAKRYRPTDKAITYKIIGNNRTFCDTLREVALEVTPALQVDRIHIISTDLSGSSIKAGAEISGLAKFIDKQRGKGFSAFRTPCLLIFGGETSVKVQGEGKGGRCTELALAAAAGLHGLANCALLTYATDGCDYICEAAGAVVDCNAKKALVEKGIDLDAHLAANDSYTALNAIGAIIPGERTGINVNDVVLLYIQ